MATKKTKLTSDSLKLEPLDLDMIDDFFDDAPAAKKNSSPIRDLKTGFKKGFLRQANTKSMIRSFMRTALPDGYSRAYGAVLDSASMAREMRDALEFKQAGELDIIAAKAQEMLPKLKGRTPEKLYKQLEDRLRSKREQYADNQNMQRDPESMRREYAREADESAIAQALETGTNLQLEVFKYQEEAEMGRFASERAERGLRDKINQGRFEGLNRSLGMINQSLTQQLAYQDQVGYQFQRKGLEIQYRSYFALRDIRKLTEVAIDVNKRAYEAMVHNTGLPDHQKATNREMLSFGIKQRASNAITGKLYESVPGFLANLIPGIRDNLSREAGQGLSVIAQLLASMQAGEGMGDAIKGAKWSMGGELLGHKAGSLAKDQLLPFLARKARPGFEKLSDKFGGQHNLLSYYMDNASSLIRDYTNDAQRGSTMTGEMMQEILRRVIPQFHMEDRLTEGGYQTIDKQAVFNQLTQRSIVEIIPGYLSRMLQEIRMLRTGRDDIERETYDLTSGGFVGYKEAMQNASSRIVTKGARVAVSGAITDALSKYDPEGKLSPQAREALSERLLRDAATNNRFDPAKYASGNGYSEATDPETLKELGAFFKTQFELDEQGKYVKTAANNAKLNEFSKSFLDIRSLTQNPGGEIERLFKSGNHEALRALGLIYTEQGIDRIDYNKVWALYRGDVSGYEPDPTAGDGPKPEDPNDPRWSAKVKRSAKAGMSNLAGKLPKFTNFKQRAEAVSGSLGDLKNKAAHELGAVPFAYQYALMQAQDKLPNIGGPGGQVEALGKGGKDLVNTKVQNIRALLTHQPETAAAREKEISDIYVKGKAELAIRASDLVAGRLTDLTTGKVINKLSDIRGVVVDEYGNTVISQRDAAMGLVTSAGERLKAVQSALPTQGLIAAKLTSLRGRLTHALTEENGLFSRIKDLYVPGRKGPVLLARDIGAGAYLDLNSDKIIETVDDITGAVADVSGKVVLTEEEFTAGLYDTEGARVHSSSSLRSSYMKATTNPAVFAFKAVKYFAKRAFTIVSGRVITLDAYLPGRDGPVLRSNLLKDGYYQDASGKTLNSFDDLRDGVWDRDGNQILTADEIPELTNWDGSKHTAAKRRSFLRKLGKKAIKGLGRGIANTHKAYMNKVVKPYYGWLGKKLASPFTSRYDAITGRREETLDERKLETPTDTILARILKTLNTRLPDDEPRKGSWQEKLSRSKADPKGDTKADPKDPKGGVLGALTASLKGMWDKFRGEDEEDDGFGLDDAADVADIHDSVRGERRGRKGRVKKRGRIGRVLDRVKGSRLGQGLGRTASRVAASGVGRFALGWGGRIAMGAGSLLAGALSAPVLLTAGAVAGAAAGGYWLYKRHSNTSGDFRALRLMQYGIDSTGEQLKVLELEALLETATTKGKEPSLNLNQLAPEKMLDIMGISRDESSKIAMFASWIEKRFKPVFYAYIRGLETVGHGRLPLNEIDDKLPAEQKYALLEAVKLPTGGDSPYQYTVSPFGDEDPLEVKQSDIEERFKELSAKFKKDQKAGAATPVKAAVATAVVGTTATSINKVATPAAIKANPALTRTPGMSSKIQTMTKGVSAGLFATGASRVVATTSFNGNQLTPLQSVRMRAYGLFTITRKDIEALLSAEDLVFANLRMAKDGSAEYVGDEGLLMQDLGTLFGVNVGDDGGQDKVTFINWLKYRFIPVVRTYAAAARMQDRSIALTRIEQGLKATQKVNVANAVVALVTPYQEEDVSVWTIPHIFDGAADGNTLKKLAEADLAVLAKEAEKETLATPTQSAGSQKANNGGSSAKQAADMASAGVKGSVTAAASNFVKGMADAVGGGISKITSSIKDTFTGVQDYFGKSDPKGNVFEGFTKGNGGKWEEVPTPTSNRSREAAMPTLLAVQQLTGVDAQLLATFCSIESAFDYLVKASTSSATGWFQFINDTWDWMHGKVASKYGIPPDTSDRAQRKDPRINAILGAEFLKGNYEILAKGLGRAPTDTDLYMAHFLGAGTAVNFLKKDQAANAAAAFPKQANANRSIFYKAAGTPRTIGEVYALMDEKVAKHRKGGASSGRQMVGAEKDPTAVADAQAAAAAANAGADTSAEADGGAVGLGANAQAAVNALEKGSVNQQVNATVNPIAAGSSGTASTTTSGAPVVGSGQGDDALQKAAEAAKQKATTVDKVNQERTSTVVAANKAAADVMEKQLVVQEAMRDYLKVIAEKMGVFSKGEASTKQPEKVTNGISKASSGTPERRVGNTPPPVSMSR
jgi:hypothetical protein